MKAVVLFLLAWFLFMAFWLKGEEIDRPLPQNIGGQWLYIPKHKESTKPPWVRLIESTNIYIETGEVHDHESIIPLDWQQQYKLTDYGIGLQWKVRF